MRHDIDRMVIHRRQNVAREYIIRCPGRYDAAPMQKYGLIEMRGQVEIMEHSDHRVAL